MKALIVIKKSPEKLFLVDLFNDEVTKEVKGLISRGRYPQAVVTALSKGSFEREVCCREAAYLDVELVLTEQNANWCCMR